MKRSELANRKNMSNGCRKRNNAPLQKGRGDSMQGLTLHASTRSRTSMF
jgi:hypothetical protein